MAKKLYVRTFGCQMNVYDSARMADVMAPAGYARTDDVEDADLVLLNTCHIREKAAEKVYSDLGRLHALKEAHARAGRRMMIAVAGCVAQAEGAEVVARAPYVDIVVGPQAYHRLPAMVARAEAAREARVDTEFPVESKFDFLPEEASGAGPGRGIASFLTVQEGCDRFCTFCVVPYTRGAEASRPAAAVEAEARRLVERGAREITLLGQNVNAYHGADADGAMSLAGLVARLARIADLERIRYTTSHPRDMAPDLIAAHGAEPKLMPFLHLPVQSGSDRILTAMNRRHTVDDYRRIIDSLRASRPDIGLSSDFIVGFPGETDADFAATMALVEEIGFAQAYSFKYSPRPGTPAAGMAPHIEEPVKAVRLGALQDLLAAQQRRANRAAVGTVSPVLFERRGRHPGQLAGRNPLAQWVHADGDDTLIGATVDVAVTAAHSNSLGGVLANPPPTRRRERDGSAREARA